MKNSEKLEILLENYASNCPNCGKKVEFSKEEKQEFDGHHLEKECPHCGKFCCFICEYVY